jgi:hypothetical protein
MVLVEVVEKAARPNRMCGDLEIVDVPIPILADGRRRRHGRELYRS